MTLPTYPPAGPQPPLPTTPPPAFAAVTREVSVGRLVSGSFSVWWRNLFKFGALTFLAIVPAMALLAGVVYTSVAAARGADGLPSLGPRGPALTMIAIFPVVLMTMVVQMGGLTYGAVQHLAGRPVRFGAMLAAGFRRALPLIGAGIVAGAMVMIGFLLLIVPGLVVASAVGVAIPAVVVEKIGPIDAIKRSFELTRDHRLTFLTASFVLGLAVFALNMALQLGVVLLGRLAPVAAIAGGAVYLLFASLPMLLPAVAYHELRIAKEGIATEDLVKVFE